jgi:RNA binding exosome subunit
LFNPAPGAILHTRLAFLAVVSRTFQALHARTLCHATEDVDKVKQAFTSAIGDTDIEISKTEGHHGNLILMIEAVLKDDEKIDEFFERFSDSDLDAIVQTLPSRVDDACNLFIRIDKQAAYAGNIKMATNEDVISVRLRVRSFPARSELAAKAVQEYVAILLEKRTAEKSP